MDGVEALDARSEKIADRPPRRRQHTAHERQTDARVHAPQEAPEGAPRHTELEHGQSSAWAEYAGELANGGPWIVHVTQQVGEGHVIERFVGERQRLGLGTHQRATIPGPGGKHV